MKFLGWGLLKLRWLISVKAKFSILQKYLLFQSHLYLTGVAAAQLLSNINVIFNSQCVFWHCWKIKKIMEWRTFDFLTPTPEEDRSGNCFKNAFKLLNLRSLQLSLLNIIHIFQYVSKIFYVKLQRVPLKFSTKFLAHIERCDFIQRSYTSLKRPQDPELSTDPLYRP